MRAALRWPRSVNTLLFDGGVFTALLIGAITAVTESKRPFLIASGVGIAATMLRLLWGWERGRYWSQYLARLNSRSLALYMVLFVVGLCGLAIAVGILVVAYQQAAQHPQVCACLPGDQGADWMDLTVVGGIGALMAVAALAAMVGSVHRMFRPWEGD